MFTRDLNNEFLELYKSVDNKIKNTYSNVDGISGYISFLEDSLHNNVIKDTYYKLKHCRWVRNRLSHDVSIDTPMATPEDIKWLSIFDKWIDYGVDPIQKYFILPQSSSNNYTQSTNSSYNTSGTYNNSGCFGSIIIMLLIGFVTIFIFKLF